MLGASTAIAEQGSCSCRLCNGPTTQRFKARILDRYDVGYWQCLGCGSLQTDKPHWLDEAYADDVQLFDTGMAARTWQMAQLTSLLLRLFRVGAAQRCVDWGGGNGLFCRMMRDQGHDFRLYDKYVRPFYSAGFEFEETASPYHVVTAFELFEHLPEPRRDLEQIAALRPQLWIFSTQLYRGQDKSWNYLSLGTGHHVFFYSDRGLRDFAAAHGYRFMPGRDLHLMIRSDAPETGRFVAWAVRRILHGGKLETGVATLNFALRQRRAHVRWQADRELLRARSKR